MKQLTLLVTFLCITLIGNAQHNFSIKNNKVVWQKIYNTNMTFDDIVTITKINGHIHSVTVIDSTIVCKFSEQRPNIENKMMPGYYLISTVAGNVTIQYKQGRYRVTIDNITLASSNNISSFYSLNSSKSDIYPIEDYAIKRGNWRMSFWGDVMYEYNKLFESIVSMKTPQHLNDEW